MYDYNLQLMTREWTVTYIVNFFLEKKVCSVGPGWNKTERENNSEGSNMFEQIKTFYLGKLKLFYMNEAVTKRAKQK